MGNNPVIRYVFFDLEEEAKKIEENATPKILMVLSQSWNGNNANVISKENNVFYSGNVNATIAKDFIFKGGDGTNSKDLMILNATTEEAVVNKLGFKESKARIESIEGSIIVRLG